MKLDRDGYYVSGKVSSISMAAMDITIFSYQIRSSYSV